MKILAPGLQAHLDTGSTNLCWCWKLVRGDGVSMGFTDHDEALIFGGLVYEAFAGFTASEIKSSLGLSVDNLDVEGALSSNRIEERHITAGLYDDAVIEIWRVNWKSTDQLTLMRSGNLGEISRGQTFFRAEVRGLAHKLQQPQGRIFQRTCDVVLGDALCGVNVATSTYRKSTTVVSVQGSETIIVSGLSAYVDGWFDRGILKFTSGANAGMSYSIRSHRKSGSSYLISTWGPVAFDVNGGDGVELTAGCDKRVETCESKFSNAAKFRGFPHMPNNDFVTSYPNTGDDNLDGATRYDTY